MTLIGGRYHIHARLGEGGMGVVYRAKDTHLDKMVAVKVLHEELKAQDDVLARFKREVKVSHRITHRNVARVFDIGEHAGRFFFTMELIEGRSLGEWIAAEGALPVERAVDWGLQICAGLQAAHEAGVIHRDLKPDNVLVANSGRVVISDFGIAGFLRNSFEGTITSGFDLGTPAYMSPEQLRALPIDHRADIYSLGTILFEMLTGTPLWPGFEAFSIIFRRFSEPPPDIRALVGDIPEVLMQLLESCLAESAEQRLSRVVEASHVLQELFAPVHTMAPQMLSPHAKEPEPFEVLAATEPLEPLLDTPTLTDEQVGQLLAVRLEPLERPPETPTPDTMGSARSSAFAEDSDSPDSRLVGASDSSEDANISQEMLFATSADWDGQEEDTASDKDESNALQEGEAETMLFEDLPKALQTPAPKLSGKVRRTDAHRVLMKDSTPGLEETDLKMAVLPFRLQGDQAFSHVSEGMTEDLIDNLSQVAGIRVLSYGAVQAYRGSFEPTEVAKALQVDFFVDGSIRPDPGIFQVRIRLLDSEGYQRWSDRRFCQSSDLLMLSDELGQLLVEQVHVQKGASIPHKQALDPGGLDYYFRARQELRRSWHGDLFDAVELFEQALRHSPHDALLLSGAAVARTRAAFLGSSQSLEHVEVARKYIAQAYRGAMTRGETHYAAGLLAFHEGRLPDAIRGLRLAIERVPSFADAHDLLGRILLEVGSIDEAIRCLAKAQILDPQLLNARWDLARAYALLGQWSEVERLLALSTEHMHDEHMRQVMCARLDLWREPAHWLAINPPAPIPSNFPTHMLAILRDVRAHRALASRQLDVMEGFLRDGATVRMKTLIYQRMAEIFGFLKEREACLKAIQHAMFTGLVDLNWLTDCPLFAQYQELPLFRALVQQLDLRVSSLMQQVQIPTVP